jgi:Flp pilus assembly protein TadG
MSRLARASERKGERGSVMVVSALGMLSVLLAVGLGVDISRFYLAKTELQNAADASALAGASALNSSPGGISDAQARAVMAMNKYDFNNTGVSFPDANVLFAVNLDGPYMNEADARASAATIKFVQVTTPPSAIGVSFAAMVLGNSKNLSATATAGLSVPLNVFCNFIPLSVIDYDIPMVPGQIYTIRAGTGNSPSPGNYQILAVAGPGGVDVEYGIGAGVDACAEPGTIYSVDTKPGLTAGKVRKGINSRFDDYQGSQLNPIDEPPDTNVKEGITHAQYLAGRDIEGSSYHNPTIYQAPSPSHQGVANRRIVLIPIVKLAEYDQGRNTIRFDRFAAFFLKTKVSNGNGGDIQAEYLDTVTLFGKGGYNPDGGAGNPLTRTPVLYK